MEWGSYGQSPNVQDRRSGLSNVLVDGQLRTFLRNPGNALPEDVEAARNWLYPYHSGVMNLGLGAPAPVDPVQALIARMLLLRRSPEPGAQMREAAFNQGVGSLLEPQPQPQEDINPLFLAASGQ